MSPAVRNIGTGEEHRAVSMCIPIGDGRFGGGTANAKVFKLPVADFSPLEMSRTESQEENRQNTILTNWLHVW